jgi:hypothetical protein
MQLCLFCVYMHTLYYRRNKFERKKNGHQNTKHNKTRRFTNEHWKIIHVFSFFRLIYLSNFSINVELVDLLPGLNYSARW